jgi:hypothetical protein
MILYIVIGIIIFLVLITIYFAIERQCNRNLYYKRAYKLSKKLNKPLMVIGDPYNGRASKVLGKNYGCGDICLDLTGCPKCVNSSKGYLEDTLPAFPDNSHVIFVSCVLEYVDDVELVYDQLKRISGGDMYVVTVQPNDYFIHMFYKGAKRRILQIHPELLYENKKYVIGLIEDYKK